MISRSTFSFFSFVLLLILPFSLGKVDLIPIPGVVFEVEVTYTDGQATNESTVLVDNGNIAMTFNPDQSGENEGRVIFRSDRKEMVVVDDTEKVYYLIDEAAMKNISGQLNDVQRQIEERIKDLPKEQQDAVRKMLEEQMGGSALGGGPKTKSELRKTSTRETKNGYPCVKYQKFTDERLTSELWVTDWDNIEGSSEAKKAFVGLKDFFSDLQEALSNFPGADFGAIGETGFEAFEEGFPVITRSFDENGDLESESILKSASRRSLDPADFEPPAGYKRKSMGE